MKKEVASSLKLLVNSPEFRDIHEYVTYRKETLYKALLQAEDFEKVSEIKGRIFEVERLLSLRDEVTAFEKEEQDG